MNLQPIFHENPPLSLYIHLPWCVKKCPYCDFNSHSVKGDKNDGVTVGNTLPEADYVQALLADLEEDLPLIWGRRINSIFIGGGTPSLFSAESISSLLSGIRARVQLLPGAEITLEANPGTAEAERFSGYFEAGINRLSIGVQSFDNQQLIKLGRIHDAEQAVQAFQMARNAGFERINLDLMFGLPGQTTEQCLQDLTQAIRLKPEHISWYQLTVEPNTVFYSAPPKLPEEAILEALNQQGLVLLAKNGYQRYEISAFCQRGEQSKHNLNYWQFGDYLGIGAGAHSKITHVPSLKILRRHKHKQPQTYLDKNKPFLAAENAIENTELPLEFMMNTLRLIEGVDADIFRKNTGLMPQLLQKLIGKAEQDGLMKNWPLKIQTSEQGLNYLNDTLSYFFAETFVSAVESSRFPTENVIPISLVK